MTCLINICRPQSGKLHYVFTHSPKVARSETVKRQILLKMPRERTQLHLMKISTVCTFIYIKLRAENEVYMKSQSNIDI